MPRPSVEREEEMDGEVPAAVRHCKSIGWRDGDESISTSYGVASQALAWPKSMVSQRASAAIHGGRRRTIEAVATRNGCKAMMGCAD